MADRQSEIGGGFTVLDGVALVTGSAVASVHIRSAGRPFNGPGDWAWAWCLFGWLTLCSAGPFLYLARRFLTRPIGYPRLGDRLWMLAGLPWLVSVLVRIGDPSGETTGGRPDPAYVGCLGMGLAFSTIIGLPLLAARYIRMDTSRPKTPPPTTWSDRIGLFLTVAWPIQCAVGLIMTG